ncbi:hypothetical protein [Porphyrobacter sp. TH134]|uniref:hypothetical protein n=1 Tax=Porphyrobacter sp. TH134 TaxID=2067450 RepID=UPI00117E5F04|nr:hypothetical protein [Porphyrobacter sp. TH134]
MLTHAEVEQVSGGSVFLDGGIVVAPRAVRSGDTFGGVWGGGPAVGSNRLAYEKYLAALDAWQARNPNLDPSIFDSIYFRY